MEDGHLGYGSNKKKHLICRLNEKKHLVYRSSNKWMGILRAVAIGLIVGLPMAFIIKSKSNIPPSVCKVSAVYHNKCFSSRKGYWDRVVLLDNGTLMFLQGKASFEPVVKVGDCIVVGDSSSIFERW
jgi:hypothetical protein